MTGALAVDMAGHGLRAAARRPSLAGLLGAGDPVVVVAHSMGGPVLTSAAQAAPGWWRTPKQTYGRDQLPKVDVPFTR